MTRPIGVDMASGRIVMEGEPFGGWLFVRGWGELATSEDAVPGRIFPEVAVRPSTGSRVIDHFAARKWHHYAAASVSRRIGRRPLP